MATLDSPIDDDERRMLIAHYDFYRGLDLGERRPTTAAQRHFVAVCRGEELPETDHERAYMRFKQAVAIAGIDEATVVVSGFMFPASPDDGEDDLSEAVEVPVRPCEGCGRPILPERLLAIPEATRCTSCQERDESKPTDWRVSNLNCPRCASKGIKSPMVWRTARDPSIPGYFLGCGRFPECRYVDRS